jgi:DNA-directed RNA polymerase specialized sigma subunit
MEMKIAVANDAVQDTYLEVEGLIKYEAFKFAKRYSQNDMEDLLSRSNEIFMRAFNTYEPGKGRSFVSWLKFLLWKIWMEHMRRKAMKDARLPRKFMEMDHHPKQESDFNFTEFLEELSSDAATVARLAVDSPKEIVLYTRERGRDTPYNMQMAIKEYLTLAGWTKERIVDSFREVADALSCV